MSGRHRQRRTRVTRTPLVIAVVAVIAAATTLVMQNLADAGGCSRSDGIELRVAADPAIAPALREIAAGWTATNDDPPEVNGRCVAVEVTAAATADVAGVLAARAGGALDVAAPPSPAPEPDEVPSVWIPDSSYWLTRTLAVDRTLFEPSPVSLAASPIVLGASPAGAVLLGEGPVTPADLREPLLSAADDPDVPRLPIAIPEPRRDTAGLAGAALLHAAVVTSDEELPQVVGLFRALGEAPPDTATLLSAFEDGLAVAPLSEQAVIAYGETAPATTVTAVPVTDAPTLDFPYAVLARQGRDIESAAALFRGAVTDATDALTRHGFRAPDGTAPPGFPIGLGVTAAPVPVLPVGPPEQVAQVLRVWTSARSDARVLTVADITASMAETMTRPSDGAEVPRMVVFQETAQLGLRLFTPGTSLGFWEYAADLGEDGADHREGVPIGVLTPEHIEEIETALFSITTAPTNQSATFETLLAAYQEMKDGYDPDRSNTLVLFTDGTSNKTDGLTLEETLGELERLADVTRPIRVVLLGLGPDADMDQLTELARVTGGGAFHIEDPDEIALVFLQGLLT